MLSFFIIYYLTFSNFYKKHKLILKNVYSRKRQQEQEGVEEERESEVGSTPSMKPDIRLDFTTQRL